MQPAHKIFIFCSEYFVSSRTRKFFATIFTLLLFQYILFVYSYSYHYMFQAKAFHLHYFSYSLAAYV